MADSIPSLRRKLAEASAEIARLKSVADAGERIVYVDRPRVVEVEVERLVAKEVVKEVEVIKYVDKPYPVEFEVIKHVDKPYPVEVEVIKYVDKPYPVEIEKAVEVKVYEKLPAEIVYVYQDNPAHLETIRVLQEKLCLITSQ